MLEHHEEGREVGTKTAGMVDRESHKRLLGYCPKVASGWRNWEAMAGCTLKEAGADLCFGNTHGDCCATEQRQRWTGEAFRKTRKLLPESMWEVMAACREASMYVIIFRHLQ